ncbi:MAG: HEAT repeat domain-containing protein, partial [Longimicrobiaceae bacterium]
VRLTAIRTLARIGTGDALPEIRRLGSEDPDALVRQAATDLVRGVDAAE